MKHLPINQPDIPYRISPIQLRTDSQITPLTEELLISDPNVISLIFGPGSSKSNPREFWIHLSGSIGIANLTYVARNPRGDIVRACGKQFSVSDWEGQTVAGGELTEGTPSDERRNVPMHA